jgi:restriction endonuclease S subunit
VSDARLASPGGMTRLKHVSTVQTGVTLSGEGDLADPEWPYLRVANVQVGYVDLSEIKTVRVPLDKAAASMLRPGDVLMTEGGEIDKLGRGALWRGELPDMLHQNHIFAVRPDEALDSEFLVYWLDGPLARTYFRTTAKQTTNLAGTNKWTLGNLPLPVPPLNEQRRIVAYLDREAARIDMLIEEQQRLVVLLVERRVAVIAEPFSQAHPTVPLGSALEELIDHRGKTPGKVGNKNDDFTDEGVPVVSAIHIKNGQISWGERERFVPYWMFEKWMPVRLHKGDVLLTSEAPLGNVAQVPSDAPLVLSQRLFALRGREDILDATYLRFFLESDRGQALLRDGASGSTVSGIRQSRLVQVPVPIPPLDEQREVSKKISEQIVKIDTLVDETERFIELARERRSALITAAVTGQIDVREMV